MSEAVKKNEILSELDLTIGILKDIALLAVFASEELLEVAKRGKILQYDPYMHVVIEGEASWGIYLILDGIVGVSKSDRMTGGQYDIAELRKGNFFGEISLIDENLRSATVRTLTYCQFFYIGAKELQDFLDENQNLKIRFYQNCARYLIQRLRDLGDSYIVTQYQLWRNVVKKEKKE